MELFKANPTNGPKKTHLLSLSTAKQLFNGSVLALSLSIGLWMEYTTESQPGAHNGKQQKVDAK